MTVPREDGLTALTGEIGDGRVAALVSFNRRVREGSRERMLDAARSLFCEHGYVPVTVEDIASLAEVSRMTFYRHFGGKSDIAVELFRQSVGGAMPRFVEIAHQPYRERETVIAWIRALFNADRANGRLLRAFNQATAEADFTARAQQLISEIIERLGKDMAEFALDPDNSTEHRRWLQAWLLIYEILDQGNHAALESGVGADPLLVEILADRFLQFVAGHTTRPELRD